ncbi:lytic transglycosylase domain-containing protein [bacterium]|nr:lytic transglycosylase domain-containing protein [bacterium]
MRRWLSLLILVLVFLGIFLWLPRILADRVYPLAYKDLIKKYALKFGIDPNLVAATIWTESRFDPYAVSPAGARGLMQLLPSTARSIAQKLGEGGLFSPDKLFDPETNIRYGTWYLAFYLRKYGEPSLALIAYNGGYMLADYYAVHRSDRFLNPETSFYYRQVQEIKEIYDRLYGRWWENKPKTEAKKKLPRLSFPPIVLMIKHWLGL